MILRFEEWLLHQQHRQDFVGELARVVDMQAVGHKFSRRKSDEHKDWADIVVGMSQPGHIAAFNVAWREFLLEKQVANETLG